MDKVAPIHIKAREDNVASRVIVVGDPARATLIAEELLDESLLVNDNRGLLVYTGKWKGKPVTIATHGMGGPSAAIVLEELYMLGSRVFVRLGTAGSLKQNVDIGDVIVAGSASSPCGGAGLSGYAGGRSSCLPNGSNPLLASRIYEELSKAGLNPILGAVVSSDSFYAEDREFIDYWASRGAVAVEMECATLFALSWIRDFMSACVLIVSNIVGGDKHLSTSELRDRILDVARVVMDVLVGMD